MLPTHPALDSVTINTHPSWRRIKSCMVYLISSMAPGLNFYVWKWRRKRTKDGSELEGGCRWDPRIPVYSLLPLHQWSDHCLPAPASSQAASEASLLACVRVRRGHRSHSTAPRFAQCAPISIILTYLNHTSSQYTFAVSHLCSSGAHQETIPATNSDGASPSETEAEHMGGIFTACTPHPSRSCTQTRHAYTFPPIRP